MRNDQFSNTLWTCFWLDEQLQIVEIQNLDDKLFFGKSPSLGETLLDAAGEENQQQAKVITSGIRKAVKEKRNSCFVYSSSYNTSDSVNVCVHVEYHDNDSVCLYLTALNEDDLGVVSQRQDRKQGLMLDDIYDELPVSIEIYNSEGRLVEINDAGLKTVGAQSREDVLGVSFFDHPILPSDAKTRLLAGENVHFTADYDFSRVTDLFKTSKKGTCNLDVNIGVIRDNAGEIDRYIIISQDITDQIQLQKKYETLYNHNVTILDSLPVGVGRYATDGSILFVNDTLCNIFGVDKEEWMKNPVNLNDNPIIPDDIKNAISKGVPLEIDFPYNLDEVVKNGYLKTLRSNIIQLKCNGKPILDASGEINSYVFIMEDVTEKIQNDEALRKNRQKTEIAMQAADIMFWEFDVAAQLFYSENEPMNNNDRSVPITIEQYVETVHSDKRDEVDQIMLQIVEGEDFSFELDARVLFPNNPEWQYCTINGSPYEYGVDGKVVRYVGIRKNNTELHKRKLLQDKILNSMPLSIHIKDVENDFRYVFCNDESKKMFGTSENKSMHDIMNADEVERIRKTDLEVFNTGNPYLGLERIELKDGRGYDTIVRKSIIDDNGKRLLLNIRWDQSLQNDLQRRSKLLALTLETMKAYTWLYEPDKECLNLGDGFSKFGRKESEVNSLEKFILCIHPDDIKEFKESLQIAVEKDSGIWEFESRFDLNNDGIYSWWEGRGMIETTMVNDVPYKYMFGMTISIDQHKKTEQILLENKEYQNNLIRQNELILNNTNSGFAYITSDYIVQWENISICSNSMSPDAYKKGELCYKSTFNRTSPCENCVMQRSIVSRQTEKNQFALDDGQIIEVFATPVLSVDDSIEGVVIRMDDISARERMIEELRVAKTQAEQSDKLKSAFLANMSHEIRTPLNAIVGFSQLLMDTVDNEDREEYINIISNNNELLLKLISDILDLSKIEAGVVEFKYEEFDLAEYFNSMVASMQQRVTNPNIRLIDVNPFESCIVNLDKNRVAQLMTNYITNAIKYTPKGLIEMGYECTDDGIRFYVKDTGIGIPDDKKDKVFHRFAKLDEFAQGTGLGLSICKAIAESMSGRVGFESVFNEGSVFWFFLPCKPIVGVKTKTED